MVKNKLILIFLACIFLAGCSIHKHLEPEEVLHDQTKINFVGKPPGNSALIKGDLIEIAEPTPNSHFLGMRIRLGIHNSVKNVKKEKGFKHWLKYRIGEPPVFYDGEKVNRSKLIMRKYLIDNGYLQAEVEVDSTTKDQLATVTYRVQSGPEYSIRQYNLPSDSTNLGKMVINNQAKSAIDTGKTYKINNLKQERFRLSKIANDSGFYSVINDMFYYFLDSTAGNRQIDLFLRIADEEDSTAHNIHYIGNTTVYPSYVLDEVRPVELADSTGTKKFNFIGQDDFVRSRTISRAVLQDYGDLYSKSLQTKTINRLLDLGVYKFVNIKYEIRPEADSTFLDRLIYLTPSLPKDFSAEIEANTEYSTSIGTALSLAFTNRNLFNGAERLRLSFSTGLETQLDQDAGFIRSLDIIGKAELEFPTLLIPFKKWRPRSPLSPRTSVSISGQYQRRSAFFTLNSFQLQFGYLWRPGERSKHEIYPFNISLVNLIQQTEDFAQLLQFNPRLRESFSDYFILGALYRYQYTNQVVNSRKNFVVFRGNIESSGNSVYGLSSLIGQPDKEPREIFRVPFAQFFRVEGDSHYHFVGRNTSLITRLNIGLAVPYANSQTIPYVRQFFVGGSNSIRAFPYRGLGPGSDSRQPSEDPGVFLDRTGDIKLEMNLEYRFPIISYLKGALFMDAGNIWLINDKGDPDSGGLFEAGDFYREIAIGTGGGLRFDISFFVLRFDVAFPLRKPSLPASQRWVWNTPEENFGTLSWFGDNLVYNLALGYPF